MLAFAMGSVYAFAGGILTNSNQSAQYIRMMSRNASLDIDAVYYNPAGLIKLQDGWHFAFYSQTIFQDKNVESQFPLLTDPNYVGKVSVPVFPTAFAVYKKENWAFSLGVGPNAGGGSAEFDRGLPTFEIPISKLVPGLAGLSQIDPSLNVTGYDADLYFKGTSVYWGIQLGVTYEINKVLSLYGGFRYLPSKNTYMGSIKNIQLNVGGTMTQAQPWMNELAGNFGNLGAMATAGANDIKTKIIDNGGGGYNLDQLVGAGFMTAADKAQLVAGLAVLGITPEQANQMTMNTIYGTFATAGTMLTSTSQTLKGTAAQLGDKAVDTEQTGESLTPMIGANISPSEGLNIALKYEFKTNLLLHNTTKVDNVGLFPDGARNVSDIPAILGIGVGYKGLKWLDAQLSYTMYFNKGVEWGYNTRDLGIWKSVDPTKIRKREIEKNGYEIGLGLQFNLSDKFAVSVGGLYGDQGVAPSYQSDFSYSNPSFTPGAGFMWKITNKLTFDAGVSNTFYKDETVPFNDPDVPTYNDILGKTTISFAAGLSYSIF